MELDPRMWPPKEFPWSGNNVGEAVIEHLGRYHILITSTDVTSPRLSSIRLLNTNTEGRGPASQPIPTNYLSGLDLAVSASGIMYMLGNISDPASAVSKIFLAEVVLGTGNIPNLGKSTIIPDDESLYAASFATVENNALAIGGWQSKLNGDNDILFLLVDNNFQPLTKKTYGYKSTHQASQSIIHTPLDGGFALTGSVYLVDGRTSMLLKIDSDGELK
jgi:hypothetical protein